MKKKIQTFNDGCCSLRCIDEDGNAGDEREHLNFEERTVGYKRYYEAMTNKVQIDRMIRVPYRPWLTTEYLAVLNDQVYELKQIQIMPDTTPRSMDISLHLTRQRRIADGGV